MAGFEGSEYEGYPDHSGDLTAKLRKIYDDGLLTPDNVEFLTPDLSEFGVPIDCMPRVVQEAQGLTCRFMPDPDQPKVIDMQVHADDPLELQVSPGVSLILNRATFAVADTGTRLFLDDGDHVETPHLRAEVEELIGGLPFAMNGLPTIEQRSEGVDDIDIGAEEVMSMCAKQLRGARLLAKSRAGEFVLLTADDTGHFSKVVNLEGVWRDRSLTAMLAISENTNESVGGIPDAYFDLSIEGGTITLKTEKSERWSVNEVGVAVLQGRMFAYLGDEGVPLHPGTERGLTKLLSKLQPQPMPMAGILDS